MGLVKRKRAPKKVDYLDGGRGCCQWIEDYCYAPIIPIGETATRWVSIGALPDTLHPETKKSYKQMWEEQKQILVECLEMKNGEFIYSLIVFCWMRGEGKSFIVCLIMLWKFFNFSRQTITLGANSKDQVTFVHFDIMKEIIQNSPRLYAIVGERDLQQKEIRFKNMKGHIVSKIRAISSFSGIVSNITGYTFSEIFDMKNPKFFVQLDGSIRNMANAFGAVDSTVSEKGHVLYQIYDNWRSGKTKKVYFSYRFSRTADPADFWNPRMTRDQIEDYRVKFPFGEFERYFMNLWEAGKVNIYTEVMIEECRCFGIDGNLLNHVAVIDALRRKHKAMEYIEDLRKKNLFVGLEDQFKVIEDVDRRVLKLPYSLIDKYGNNQMITQSELNDLGDMLETDWCVLVGIDFADPMSTRSRARTIITVVLKGLPKSRTDVSLIIDEESRVKYFYFLVGVFDVEDKSVTTVKQILEGIQNELDIDVLCSERYGSWDLPNFCEDNDIEFEPIHPSYDRQREAFKEVYTARKEGRFKVPHLAINGSKSEDIFVEEARVFHHDPDKRVFGSPEKAEATGIQDDFMYSEAWALYGGRLKTVNDFRPRKPKGSFGMFFPAEGLIGNY